MTFPRGCKRHPGIHRQASTRACCATTVGELGTAESIRGPSSSCLSAGFAVTAPVAALAIPAFPALAPFATRLGALLALRTGLGRDFRARRLVADLPGQAHLPPAAQPDQLAEDFLPFRTALACC